MSNTANVLRRTEPDGVAPELLLVTAADRRDLRGGPLEPSRYGWCWLLGLRPASRSGERILHWRTRAAARPDRYLRRGRRHGQPFLSGESGGQLGQAAAIGAG